MSKNAKKFSKRLDSGILICYTLTVARGSAQALGTSGIHGVRPELEIRQGTVTETRNERIHNGAAR